MKIKFVALCLFSILSIIAIAQSPPVLNISDTFTDSNGTAIESHTMNAGLGWINRGVASGEIQSNELDVTNVNSVFTTWTSGATGTFIVDVRVAAGTGWQVGHVIRWADSTNYIVGEIINTAGGKIRLYRVVNGSPTGISEKAYTLANGTNYTLTFSVQSDSIELKVDDGVTIDSLSKAESFNNTQTVHGLYSTPSNSFFDDYSATLLPLTSGERRRGLSR